jgi:hypothetical protein
MQEDPTISAELEPSQKLLLWLLAIQERSGIHLKDLKVRLSCAGKRKQLMKLGLTQETGRPIFIELTDKGWLWCQDHLSDPLPVPSRGSHALLLGLMSILAEYFRCQDHTVSIGQLIQQSRMSKAASNPSLSSLVEPSFDARTLEQAILSASLQVGKQRNNVRVRLADMRPLLKDFSRSDVDQMILAMELSGALAVMQLDNPLEISVADRAAALRTASGTEKHILYVQGSRS